jgi:hypothetical protein
MVIFVCAAAVPLQSSMASTSRHCAPRVSITVVLLTTR